MTGNNGETVTSETYDIDDPEDKRPYFKLPVRIASSDLEPGDVLEVTVKRIPAGEENNDNTTADNGSGVPDQ